MAKRVGILSDTHGHLSEEVLEDLKQCDVVIHAGDFTDESILNKIRFIGQIFCVRGNCDYWAKNLKDKLLFRIEGVKFLLVHNPANVGADVTKADVIIYGHTHKADLKQTENRLWLNPGSVTSPRGCEPSYMIMQIDGKDYTIEKKIVRRF